MGIRRRSRECALQILYGIDWNTQDATIACDLYWDRFAGERPAAYAQIRAGSDELVIGVVQHRAAIDDVLRASSHNWKLDRMSVVDRNILRMGAYELLFSKGAAPRKVVLNEAIEIAKKFGSKDSGGFVNGVLHQVSLRKGGQPSPPSPADPEPASPESASAESVSAGAAGGTGPGDEGASV